MRISDWSSDVCSSDLVGVVGAGRGRGGVGAAVDRAVRDAARAAFQPPRMAGPGHRLRRRALAQRRQLADRVADRAGGAAGGAGRVGVRLGLEQGPRPAVRSEEHTSELQSLMRISYAVFCLKKKKKKNK